MTKEKIMKQFATSLRAAFTLLLLLTLLLGVVYPLGVTAIGQVLFSTKAGGSLIRGDKVMGSALIGQQFEHSKYFWSRLSATTPPYNASASTGSNLSPANPKLLEAANARIAALQQADPDNKAPIPVELVTSSASGLDPHISLDAARYQLARVARVRHRSADDISALLDQYTESNFFGLLGDPYVNVVRVNRALDQDSGEKK